MATEWMAGTVSVACFDLPASVLAFGASAQTASGYNAYVHRWTIAWETSQMSAICHAPCPNFRARYVIWCPVVFCVEGSVFVQVLIHCDWVTTMNARFDLSGLGFTMPEPKPET